MACEHEQGEQDAAMVFDGYCPICQAQQIDALTKESAYLKAILADWLVDGGCFCLGAEEMRGKPLCAFCRTKEALAPSLDAGKKGK